LLLPSIFSRYGLLGFDVKLNHYGRDGSLQHSATLRGTEVMVTSNRVIAGYGGIPGAWGDTKLLVLPSGPLGVLGLSEIVGRGVLTKYLGLNMVGPTSRLLTLAGKRQILIHPGESVQVQLQVPDTWRWNALRRIRASAEPIPAAGAPMGVPAIRDGEVAGRISDFTVRVPETFGVLLAHPQSQAVRLIRASALARGTEPLVSDQQLLSRTAKRWGRTAVGNRKGGVRVQTDFLSQPRLFQLVKQYKIPFELTADLLVATQAISHSEKLGQLADPKTPLSIKRIEQFLTSEAGDKWLRRNRALGRTADRRILEGGVPLAAGILALWGGEHLADAVGLDPRQDQVLRFGLVAYVAYGVHRNVTPLWEVHANRMRGRPYDQVRIRNVRVAGETFTQWTFRHRPSLPGAAVSSWSSGALQINPRTLRPLSPENYHRRVPLSRKIENLAALPFRAAWNMGHVLICSAAAAGLAVHLPEGSFLKRYGPEAALFMPDVGRFLAPGLTFQFLENLPVRLAARALAVGFMADMAYMGMRRYALGPEADYENSLNYRAAQLRRDAVDIAPWSFRNIFGFLAPSLSAHLDSHAYGFGKENEYRRLVRRHDLEMPERLKGAVRRETPWISRALSVTPGEVFQTKVSLTSLENDMVSQLEFAHANKLVSERGSLEETAGYLMEQFRGYRLTSEQTYRHLARIRLSQLQDEISQMHVLNRLEGLELQILFDREGKIKPGKEISFLNWLRPEPFADPLWLAVGT
jgi:hypothetical protein